MAWQRLSVWFIGATLARLVASFGATLVLYSGSALLTEVGDGEGRRFDEATEIVDIRGGDGELLEIQRGVERVRLVGGFDWKD